MEDCRIGKELKQSTCRYVKECKRGWTRNDKFICRKTERRLKDPNEPVRKFTTKKELRKFTVRPLSVIEENRSPRKFSVKSNTKTFSQLRTPRKLNVGNSFTYKHPDGRKEKVRVTGVGPNGVEVHIPSLANEVANSKFKKNEKVFFIYKTGMKEQGIIKKVYDREYDVQLLAPLRIRRIKERNLRAMSDYKRIEQFPYYVLKNA